MMKNNEKKKPKKKKKTKTKSFSPRLFQQQLIKQLWRWQQQQIKQAWRNAALSSSHTILVWIHA